MPHITIEHSANVATHHDMDALVSTVHQAALDHGLASPTALRTRAASREHYKVMSGDEKFAFVAITCRVGPGRDHAAKTSFIEAVLNAAIDDLAANDLAANDLVIAWSIELTEIDPEFRINRNNVRTALENRDDKNMMEKS